MVLKTLSGTCLIPSCCYIANLKKVKKKNNNKKMTKSPWSVFMFPIKTRVLHSNIYNNCLKSNFLFDKSVLIFGMYR